MDNESRATIEFVSQIRRFADTATPAGGAFPTGIDGLDISQARSLTRLEKTMYNPVVCLILQGAKELVIAERRMSCKQGQFVIVSHDTPVASRITHASYESPYLAMTLRLDPAVLRSLIDEIGGPGGDDRPSTSIQIGQTDDELRDAMSRLFALKDRPQDVEVLAPLIRREIHYRLLATAQGHALRLLARRSGQAARISDAIAAIRNDLARPISVPDLARRSNMSPSTFHQHFKAITETTPLQYQKQLRLLEARRLLAEAGRSVSDAAHAVGYRSTTQFSREYVRAFGMPPRDTVTTSSTQT